MKYTELVKQALEHVEEIFPWDTSEALKNNPETLLLDIRESLEFDAAHIDKSMHVPRGILESSCEYNFDDTIPELVEARNRPLVVVCRSGNRSALAARTLQNMGYINVKSMKTGLRGWNDYELPLVDKNDNPVDIDRADKLFNPPVRDNQLDPER